MGASLPAVATAWCPRHPGGLRAERMVSGRWAWEAAARFHEWRCVRSRGLLGLRSRRHPWPGGDRELELGAYCRNLARKAVRRARARAGGPHCARASTGAGSTPLRTPSGRGLPHGPSQRRCRRGDVRGAPQAPAASLVAATACSVNRPCRSRCITHAGGTARARTNVPTALGLRSPARRGMRRWSRPPCRRPTRTAGCARPMPARRTARGATPEEARRVHQAGQGARPFRA